MKFVVGVLALAVLAVAGVCGWFAYAAYGDRTLPAGDTTVIVPRGSTTGDVARLLSADRVIGSAQVLQLLARLRHDEARVQAGEFKFTAHATTSEVLAHLVRGGAQVAVWVTFPEGYTARQMAEVLAAHGLGDALAYDRAFRAESIVVDGERTPTLEGFLFPSTYLIPTNATPAAVIKILTDQFRTELPQGAARAAKRLGVSVVQAVTLASMIEREAKADDERRLMAGVYYNRLRLRMPLEVDATIEYTFPYHKTEITRADLAGDSPYNTYKHLGLPPTPIANPGHASLVAAFDPQPSSYLFYVYKGNGHHAFARTLAEHNANVARYEKQEVVIETHNGEPPEGAKVDLHDILVIETHDGKRLEFEVIGIVEDDDGQGYAVCYNEEADEFVVTNDSGKLLEDEDLAQEILDDFFELADDEEGEGEEESPAAGGEEKPKA